MHRRGLTLAELIIALVIFGVVTVVIVNAYLASGILTVKEDVRTRVGVEASRTLSTLDSLLRQGKSILAQYPAVSPTYTTDSNTLIFTVPSLLASGELSATDNDTIVVDYNSSARRIDIMTFPNASAPSTRSSDPQVGAYEVEGLYIRYPTTDPTAATTVTVTATLKKQRNTQSYTQTSILYGAFRNH